METGTIISLAVYFLAMLAIGLYGYKTSTDDVSGYMLGGRKLGPGVTALSAGASDMSGWMLLGVPGAMYLSGVSSAWIAVGLLIGAYVNYLIVAPRLRVYTEVAHDAITIPDYFEKRFADKTRLLRVVSSIVIVIFFTLYTSSGVVGGGKLFESSFGLSYELGLYVTAGVVVAYTLFGGFMAVSITDFVQGCIMFIALVLVPLVAIDHLGGLGSVFEQVNTIDSNFIDPFTDAKTAQAMSLLGIISLLSWGFGYFGQPHIIVRFMAIRSVSDIKTARRIGMSWMLITIIGALMTGLVGIAYVENTKMTLNDAETIFIVFSQFLFHPLISGFLLAAILAAIMSTISSQLLVTSSSLTEDFYKAFVKRDASQKELVMVGRLSVLVVALVAIALAYDRDSTILSLVSNAWAGFGAAFGPMIVLSLYWKRMTFAGALSGIISGAATVLFWIYAPVLENGQSLSSLVYEIVPGVIVSTLCIVVVSKFSKAPADEVTTLFDTMRQQLKQS
ncbi:sodium/proline symporter PutP [Rheinheimera nanhaiensis]|uniref:Sodium/proline symporter n=1 Tax=Rheinheimera nanhaiensis E407-8 TaxID=562729 RepID=I1E1G9_9GAMM|nr:sodium/proline symporter PutP [Rheinheimera nanhaiensis]GAB60147.1 osmoregulated proline transporter [Rheinheimera nanhaiensis E407-8]